MFWKKKNDDVITIELDSDDRRNGIRIQPLDEVMVDYSSKLFKLVDISFRGMAFEIPEAESLHINESINVSLILSSENMEKASIEQISIAIRIKVIQIHGQTCHCQFIDLSYEAQQSIDQFILNEQKRQIQSQNQSII